MYSTLRMSIADAPDHIAGMPAPDKLRAAHRIQLVTRRPLDGDLACALPSCLLTPDQERRLNLYVSEFNPHT